MIQLPLNIGWSQVPSFETFASGNNEDALQTVHTLSLHGGVPVLLHGMPGTGKTHLLQAAVRAAEEAGRRSVHISLADCISRSVSHELTTDFDEIAVLALDDYESACTDRKWAEALIRLIDRRRTDGQALLFASRRSPSALPSDTMPDLRSRLAACAVFCLRPLTEMNQREALKRHARARGLALDDNVVNYMIHRLPRDLSTLISILESLSTVSLSTQRRLTVPFVQEWLSSMPHSIHHEVKPGM